MAYTFAVQAVDGYFEDQDAIDISTILQCRFRGTKRKALYVI